ncbi:hypothetical protein CERZMDRAFT_99054 [Cercospora zeae-maydis SCOH1-5]|uniref:Fumarylacetoacetase n=1 Tax=Cercospora zeae-maydis SCOH1-5 TaxID=717836 RepID=A0A6A6FBV5_9PEZI|nr:hypothetical protein CERZMDRAFT_99054 [Cercospora zeae-maydis SCOH1-5]
MAKNGIDSEPVYGPSEKLYFELEMGLLQQTSTLRRDLGNRQREEHGFGFGLLNDWSAIDHQLCEMRPLGPFHFKGFGMRVSNWSVSLKALGRLETMPYLAQDPSLFPLLA